MIISNKVIKNIPNNNINKSINPYSVLTPPGGFLYFNQIIIILCKNVSVYFISTLLI